MLRRSGTDPRTSADRTQGDRRKNRWGGPSKQNGIGSARANPSARHDAGASKRWKGIGRRLLARKNRDKKEKKGQAQNSKDLSFYGNPIDNVDTPPNDHALTHGPAGRPKRTDVACPGLPRTARREDNRL